MRATVGMAVVVLLLVPGAGRERVVAGQQDAAGADDPVAVLVGRLDLERYKAVIRGLTRFGDRRQGTRRNREAVDWIEARLEAAGCSTVPSGTTTPTIRRPAATAPDHAAQAMAR